MLGRTIEDISFLNSYANQDLIQILKLIKALLNFHLYLLSKMLSSLAKGINESLKNTIKRQSFLFTWTARKLGATFTLLQHVCRSPLHQKNLGARVNTVGARFPIRPRNLNFYQIPQ